MRFVVVKQRQTVAISKVFFQYFIVTSHGEFPGVETRAIKGFIQTIFGRRHFLSQIFGDEMGECSFFEVDVVGFRVCFTAYVV